MALNYINIEFYIDDVVDHNEELREKFNTNNKLTDFKVNDIVMCTYIKTFCTVVGIEKSKIKLQAIDTNDVFEIRPYFLKKVKANKKLLKVLYENTGFKSRGLRNRT